MCMSEIRPSSNKPALAIQKRYKSWNSSFNHYYFSEQTVTSLKKMCFPVCIPFIAMANSTSSKNKQHEMLAK